MFKPCRVTPSIYQDGYITEKEGAELLKLGVTHLLNLDLPYRATRIDMSGLGLSITELVVHDVSALTDEVARRVVAVIQRAVDIDGGKIYIHCNAGLSRSPTAAWLYLVATGWDESAATAAVAGEAKYLHGPDATLIVGVDLEGLKAWIRSPRWEIWSEFCGSRTLAATFEREAAARSELEKLEREWEAHRGERRERETIRYWLEAVEAG